MSEELIKKMKEAIFSYDKDKAVAVAEEVLKSDMDPVEAIEKGFAPAIREIGEKFENMEIFLPQLVTAAEAMTAAVAVLNKALAEQGKTVKRKGTLVIGTVEGDIHDIGKTIVIAMLRAAGYEVHDLGKDVPVPTFIERAKSTNADIIGLSALLSTTLVRQGEVIELLKQQGIREKYKVIVGGAPVSEAWAKQIGADGYARDATRAVKIVNELLGQET
ncbi:MAG: cobalamin B12-binding domain-containing protein [Candidatus Ranarchaeia archaeon]